MEQKLFNELFSINVNGHTEVRNNGQTKLTYLSWSWAWAEFKKRCPNAKYEIKTFNGLPYVFDEKTGYMVFTSVTVDDVTHDMWLPVMDSNNKAMKDKPYEYTTKLGKKTVAPATMFDVNKTIMRCLVKNLAMFGLGLYIYSGEDLPEQEQKEEMPKQAPKVDNVEFATEEQIGMLNALGYKGKTPAKSLTKEEAEKYIQMGIAMKKGVKKGVK
jgi:hypothetical protein